MDMSEQLVDLLSNPSDIAASGVKGRVFDKQTGSYCYNLNTSACNLKLLNNTHKACSSVVLQVWIPAGKHFNFELILSNTNDKVK